MIRASEGFGFTVADPEDRSPARREGNRLVEEQARRQVRTFFDELKNGTRNYRTVASLSGQITQEYRGRCVLELLQNAHDALAGARPDDPRRISFVLVTEPEPVLLIANSGRPFRQRDFEGICQLGQSPKDPNESVGNKGLGFQSVLEVSTRPQIWSTAAQEGDPAFVFGFDPAGTMRLVDQAVAEVASAFSAPEAVTDRRILNWSEGQLREYRRRGRADGAVDAAGEARNYVSPYTIPLPIEETPPEVAELLDEGHVTVIRLCLDGGRNAAANKVVESIEDAGPTTGGEAKQRRAVNEAVKSIRDQLDELDARSVVFLPDIEKLTVEIDGDRRVLERIVDSTADLPGSRPAREQVLLVGRSAGGTRGNDTREFRRWTRFHGGDDDTDEAKRIRDAVKHLPNRWPEVRKVEVGVAVADTASAEPGTFVIFLPTEVGTGTGALVNAPFYGSLDRRQINFEDEYNSLLLEYVMDLALDVAAELAAGPPEGWRARAVIDLLASAGPRPADGRPTLMDQMRQRADGHATELANTALLLCDDGWRRAESARIMPDIPGGGPLDADRWRTNAEFDVVSSELDGRHKEVEALLDFLGGSSTPTPAEWASTVECLADRIHRSEIKASWDAFLTSLRAVLPQEIQSEPRTGAADPLSDTKFLPTQDNRVLSASGVVQVFFRPRRGFDDAADFVDRVPDSLADRIAFLHDGVRTHEGPQRRNTEVQSFLSGRNGRFVQSFRREDLLRDVVLPALPDLPVRHGTPEAERCSEILGWTLLLLGGEELEAVDDLLGRLPVACHGGWLAAGEAVFGPEWQDRHGECIQTLADGLPEGGHRLLDQALLPPRDRQWGLDAAVPNGLLERAGVVDGLPTETAAPVVFSMSAKYRDLPRDAPQGTPQDAWDDWLGACEGELEPEIKSRTTYRLADVHLASEIHFLENLEGTAREALSDLILSSLEKWDATWESATVTRPRYPNFPTNITSPLKHWLTTLPWLHDNEVEPQPLCQRWFVPESLLRGQRGRFAHLAPLSLNLAHRLGETPELLATLVRLGLNVFPTEDDRTGPELLEALAAACDEGTMPACGFDVFLGQVRRAWNHLDPDAELPTRFPVRTMARRFEPLTDLSDAYLPDHNTRSRLLRDHRKPILEMNLAEAQGAVGTRLDALEPRRASNLQERCLADGQPVLDDAAEGAKSIEDSALSWLPPILLTLAAHGGANPRGPATGAWRDAKAELRRTRIRWCGTLAVEVTDGEQVVAPSEPQAHWLPNQGVLLICRDAEYEELAPACQALLDRQDLLRDLRLVLGALPSNGPAPTRRQIEASLDRAEIDTETFADICGRWDADAAHVVDRMRPVMKLLDIPDDGLDAAAADAETLATWLSARLPGHQAHQWSADDLLSAARKSHDDQDMGREAWQRLGEVAQLPEWNAILGELGQRYEPVENDYAAEQTTRHRAEAATSLRALARHVAIETGEPDLFGRLEEACENFKAPTEWSSRWWEVPFGAVLKEMRTAYADALAVVPGLVNDLDDASTLADLRTALVQRGVDLDIDPYETYRRNENRLRKEIGKARDLHRAWLEVSGAEPAAPRDGVSGSPRMNASAYLRDWSETAIFEQALEAVDDAEFRRQCDGCGSVGEARLKLGVTPEAVEQAQRKRRERQREAERANRTFPIAGKLFEVGGPESYGDLLARLDALPDLKGPSLKSDESAPLAHPGPGPAPRPSPVPPAPGRTSQRYSSPHLPGLVGIVGEMHAYRYLRSEFGNAVVTPAAWVSENSLKVLPPARSETRDASDRHGFDFRFVSDGITWHFEVKATTEDDTSFSLPPSEIRAATRLANRRNDRWRILHIRSALSDKPEILPLPNPFETGFSDLFRLNSGGMTVRYALADAV